ncbi:CHASE domain-containing protein [Mesorhizobium sp. BAC0120]|uniref:CHASE domain-containing protein n=1 Tax=Mesorhizobium sp. BAC0120 TaxID=3090670 RepID=UPI00298C0CE1|nr:CHASE domain-containing protein [Mesorhizobium sp. BAC0120]MDW6022040.1 CHASE domain-containing protein [Mesorhizobium sp. BAC0120]
MACASLVTAWLAYVGVQDATRLKFEASADDALNRIESTVDLNLSLLTSTRAFLRLRGADMSRVQFKQFFDALNVDQNFKGLRGIGYLRMIRTGNEEDAQRDIVKAQGMERRVFPATDQDWRAPIILFEPLDPENAAGIGYDMFSEPIRRAAIESALRTGQPVASGRLLLGQATGDERTYPGFIVFAPLADAPVHREGAEPPPEPIGLLFVAFRVEDLFNAALGRAPLLPVNVEIYDGAIDPEKLLFRSEGKPDEVLGNVITVTRQAKVAGRTWYLQFRPTSAFTAPTSSATPILIGIGGLLLAAAVALVVRLQNQAAETEAALRMTSEKALLERELILQEMKHRIKNSIARVLAIARQTGTSSKSIEEFTASFSARLQAMAASQDMLTRSQWQKADLGSLLRTELEQVFGQNIDRVRLSGPPVELNEHTTQALGLTFHELATNALKYGEAGSENGALSVEWAITRANGKPNLVLKWMESGQSAVPEPSRTGFGTRLIDMNITRELQGTIAREFGGNGLMIDIELPLQE